MYQAVGAPGSRLTRVTWMLEELDQPYEIVSAKQHSETMYRYNPSGKMPALVDGDFVLVDSAAICAYLAERHPEKDMAPRDEGERAQILSWLFFAQAELEPPLWNKLKHRLLLPQEQRAEIGLWVAAEFAREIAVLEKRLGAGPFAMGERFTAADILLGHCGRWARGAKFEIGSAAVNAYFDCVLSRPALGRALEREKAS